MTFYHIPDNHLPKEAQYYFNVLVISIGLDQKEWKEVFNKNIKEIWYIEQITEFKPRVYHFYVINTKLSEYIQLEDLEIEILPHQVVEIYPTSQIYIYDMLDFNSRSLWGID